MQQLTLWNTPDIHPDIEPVLADPECAIALSISGGKDSQAMLNWVLHLRQQYGWKGECYAIHSDLGRIEWPQTPAFVEKLAYEAGVELIVVRREKGDMIDRWRERYEVLKAQGNTKPFWSSATSRYCTKELKEQVVDKYLRRHNLVVNVMGLRANESAARAKKEVVSVRQGIATEYIKALSPEQAWAEWNKRDRKGRFALNWNPIHHWDIYWVWEWCGTSYSEWEQRRRLPDEQALAGWTAHPAYVLGKGNERLSCSFCVLGSLNDLTNAIPYNPETYQTLVDMERESGWTFQQGRSLESLTQ
jgi:3'-phosphoadenosine 5'-phosphosulfate sulfotransferase (PAPS reductase)/FAD synthetase